MGKTTNTTPDRAADNTADNAGNRQGGNANDGRQYARNEQQLDSGNVAKGHPANNVITPQSQRNLDSVDRQADAATGVDAGSGGGTEPVARRATRAGQATHGGEAGTRGSGNEPISGAGKLADDRPGRDAPKGS